MFADQMPIAVVNGGGATITISGTREVSNGNVMTKAGSDQLGTELGVAKDQNLLD